jgi:cell division protein FtsB
MRRAWKKRMENARRVIYILFILLIAIFLVRAVLRVYEKNSLARSARDERLIELDLLSDRQESLGSEVDSLSTPRGIEEAIRTQFHVAKPGEMTIVLIDPVDEAEDNKTEKRFWRQIKSFFKLE